MQIVGRAIRLSKLTRTLLAIFDLASEVDDTASHLRDAEFVVAGKRLAAWTISSAFAKRSAGDHGSRLRRAMGKSGERKKG